MSGEELLPLFERYRDSFNRLDAESAAAAYQAPAFVVKNGSIERFDAEGKGAYFAHLMTLNASQGEHTWEIADFSVETLAVNGAIITVRWVCRRPDGSTIWDFGDTYVVARVGDEWRILGDIVHDNIDEDA